jgi:LysR family transcriptional regulator for bpeEF and oprC
MRVGRRARVSRQVRRAAQHRRSRRAQGGQYFSSRTGRTIDWTFLTDGKEVEVKMNAIVSVNDADAYVTCGLEGFGLIQPPLFMVLPHLRDGRLKEVLPGLKPLPMPISVVYPHSRHLSPKVRVFVDWIAEVFDRCPLLSGKGSLDATCSKRTFEEAERAPARHAGHQRVGRVGA